jgi:hypothetical protein
MRSTPPLSALRAVCVLIIVGTGLGIVPAEADGPARDENSARYAVYDCKIPADEAARRKTAAEFGEAPFDRNKFGCSADIWNAIASDRPGDRSVQLQALAAHTAYINEINTLWDLDFYGIRAPEWEARIKHATGQADRIANRLPKLTPSTPESEAAIAMYNVAWTFKYADTKTALAASRAALKQLSDATGAAPKLFDGLALYDLARLYYELPEFSGGDTSKGVAAITKAYGADGANPTVIRYYAFVQAQEGHPDREKVALAKMLALNATGGQLQVLVDELLIGRDLATRLQQKDIADRLTAKRDGILADHKELQRRAHTAANLHGGVDPITGKEY